MNAVAETAMTESFAEMFERSQSIANLKPGSIVLGTVVEIRSDVVVINAGLKSEGIVPIEQFRNDDGVLEIHVGDEVKVALDSLENGFRRNRALARKGQAFAGVGRARGSALEANESVTGRISGKVKGGFTVDIKDVRAFLPGSLVDVRPVRDPSYLEGKELEFKIIKLDRKRNNVVVSRRAVVESEFSVEREQLLDRLQENAVVKGVVKNLTDYGAFVDLGGIDGLLHITDMAWKRVRHPSEVVNVGDELDVRVLKFDRERNRVSAWA
jgi:small subunit ribosomal protein S1